MRLQVEQMIITAGDKLTTNKKLTSKFFVEALKKQNVKKTNNKEQRSFKTPKCSACKVALTWYIAARSVTWDREARGPFRLRTMLHHVVSTISERKFVQKYMSVMGAHVLNVREGAYPECRSMDGCRCNRAIQRTPVIHNSWCSSRGGSGVLEVPALALQIVVSRISATPRPNIHPERFVIEV